MLKHGLIYWQDIPYELKMPLNFHVWLACSRERNFIHFQVKQSHGKHQSEVVPGRKPAVSVLDKLQHDQRKLLHSMSKVICRFVALVQRPAVLTSRNGRSFLEVLTRVQVASDPKRPRILVAAPSNAAVDLLVKRIMDKQFLDKAGMHMNREYCGRFCKERPGDFVWPMPALKVSRNCVYRQKVLANHGATWTWARPESWGRLGSQDGSAIRPVSGMFV